MSNPNPPAPALPAPRWLLWIGLIAFIGYGIFVYLNYSNVAGGSDSSGYLNSARLMVAGKLTTEVRVPAEFGPPAAVHRTHFLPLGFWLFEGETKLTPTYPTGLPLHFAFAGGLTDWITGPRLIGLFAALGAVGLCYAVAREIGLDARLAAAGAVAFAACPVFLFASFQPMSDTLASTWCLASVWTAMRARRHRGWAAACGTAFAVAVLVRPTNLVLLPALVVLLGFDWRRLALATFGGLPGVAWLAFYNHALYGGALKSGYGDWTATFAWSWGPPTAWHFLKWLAALLPTPLLFLSFAAITAPALRTRNLLALIVWFAAITGVYTFYEVSHEVWWCLRFIVPAMPALILLGLLGVEVLARRRPAPLQDRFRGWAALTITVWAIGAGVFWNRQYAITDTKNGEKIFSKACAAVAEQVPPGTLIVTQTFSGAFYYYTGFAILRWDQVQPVDFARYVALAQKAGRSIVAVDYKWDLERAFKENCPGNWVLTGHVFDAQIWRLAPAAAGADSK